MKKACNELEEENSAVITVLLLWSLSSPTIPWIVEMRELIIDTALRET